MPEGNTRESKLNDAIKSIHGVKRETAHTQRRCCYTKYIGLQLKYNFGKT